MKNPKCEVGLRSLFRRDVVLYDWHPLCNDVAEVPGVIPIFGATPPFSGYVTLYETGTSLTELLAVLVQRTRPV